MITTFGGPTDFRLAVMPTPRNGLAEPSLVLADKLVTLRLEAIEKIAGTLEETTMGRLDDALRGWLDI